jgi:sugar lactone lactonase YvrE
MWGVQMNPSSSGRLFSRCCPSHGLSGVTLTQLLALSILCLTLSQIVRAQIVIPSTGYIGAIAGGGVSPFCVNSTDSVGDGCLATSAQLSGPTGVAFDSSGNVYIADSGGHRIRMVTASTGIISTIAGTGTWGFSGDGGAATSADLTNPWGIGVDSSGNVYFSDFGNNRIREIVAGTGVITTIAGGGTVCLGATDVAGDGCPATQAVLSDPMGIRVDASANVYIADSSYMRIRKITASTGVISAIAGNGTAGFSGDSGAATSAELDGPGGLAIDSSGNIWIADVSNSRVREVSFSTGYINTVMGGGSFPSCGGETDVYGDGCAATSARLEFPVDVIVDSSGNAFVVDYNSQSVRVVSPSTGVISLYAGDLNYSGLCLGATDGVGDGCLAANDGASLSDPAGIALDASNNLYIADEGNNLVRVVGH